MAVTREVFEAVIKASTSGAVGPLKAWEKQVEQSNTAFDKFSKKIGVSSASLKAGLAGMVSGLSIGTLVSGVQQVADAYVTAAEGANLLSKATNASVEDASRFNAVASRMGLGMNDLVEIFADFQQAAAAGGKDMERLGVSLSKNAAGQTDWVATATEFLTKIQSIGDATERNRLLFKFFGEEGAKQLMALVSSGRSVAEQMAAVSDAQALNAADARAAEDYRQSMASLKKTVDDLSISLGRGLVPALAGAADGLKVLADAWSALGDKLPGDFLTRALPVVMLGLKGIGKAFGDSADEVDAAAAELGQSVGDAFAGLDQNLAPPVNALQALNDMFAAGIPDARAYAGAVQAAAEAQAQQEGAARGAAAAIDAYRASTDLAWEATLNLVDAENATFDAHRALIDGIDAVGEARARAREADARAVAGPSEAERDRVRQQIKDAERDLRAAKRKVGEARKDVRAAFTVGELRDAKAALKAAQDAVDAAQERRASAVAKGPSASERASARQAADQARQDARDAEDRILRLAQAQAAAVVAQKRGLAELKGQTMSLADEHDLYIKSLQESKKLATTDKERAAIQDLIDKLKEAQKVAGEGIKIGKIRYETGTTKKQVDTLKQTIRDAMVGAVPWAMGAQAQAQLDAITIPIAIGGQDQAKNDLLGVTKGKDGKDRTAKVNVSLVGDAEAKAKLDELALDRTVTLTYSVVPPTTPAYPPYTGLPRAGGQAMPSSLSVAGGGANGAGVNYAPTIVNNYPKPERASDSIASSLRVARYLVGV